MPVPERNCANRSSLPASVQSRVGTRRERRFATAQRRVNVKRRCTNCATATPWIVADLNSADITGMSTARVNVGSVVRSTLNNPSSSRPLVPPSARAETTRASTVRPQNRTRHARSTRVVQASVRVDRAKRSGCRDQIADPEVEHRGQRDLDGNLQERFSAMTAHHRTRLEGHCRLLRRWTAPLLLACLACSAVEPLARVTLSVRNATCDPGPCQAIRVLAFPQVQPITPGGMWSIDLGVVTAVTTCLAIPAEAHFTVTNTGSGATSVTNWTSGDSLSLAPWPPSDGRFTARPTTTSFVPATANSWSVTLPGTAAPVAANACDP